MLHRLDQVTLEVFLPGKYLPHCDPPAPYVSAWRELTTLKGVQGEPLDRPVVVVSETVVVAGEEVFAQGCIAKSD